MKRWSGLPGAARCRPRCLVAVLFVALSLGLGLTDVAAAAASEPQAAPAAPAKPDRGRSNEECSRLAPANWPSSAIARRLQIARLQLARVSCIDNPDFLAALGALILEDGDAEQALIWLERALLLDPENRGAQADHALALADLGQPDALQELKRSWQGRSDLPNALRQKLFPADTRNAFAFPPVRLGQTAAPSWAAQGEISLVGGYENNLDRSPKLTELTLTIPDGPLVLPVISQPRSGKAALGAASLQLAYALTPSLVLRSGLNLVGRNAPTTQGTDWKQMQWAANAAHQAGWLRTQADVSVSWIGGSLSESYRLDRSGISLETAAFECRARVGYEIERRTQSRTGSFNSSAAGWLASAQCPVPLLPSWQASLVLRGGRDRPASEERPGGRQQLSSTGLRLVGAIGRGTRVELGARENAVHDELGYSVLLNDNEARRLSLRQYSLELAHSLDDYGWAGLELTLQLQSARQSSNLRLFAYRADSWYGGLRWSW